MNTLYLRSFCDIINKSTLNENKNIPKFILRIFFRPDKLKGVLWDSSFDRISMEVQRNMDRISFFSADYRDGRMHIGGKSYPAGTFAAYLLTQYYINDTAARIIVVTSDNWLLERSLERGYLHVPSFL